MRKRAETARTGTKDEKDVKTEIKADENGEEEDDDDDESGDEDFDPDAVDEDASGRDSDDSGVSEGEGDGEGSGSDSDAENEPTKRAVKEVPKVAARSPIKKRKAAAVAASKIAEEINDMPPVRKQKLEEGSVTESADTLAYSKIKVEASEEIFVKDEG